MYPLGWFSTGRDAAASDLLKTVQEAIRRGEIEGEIAFVFSNREPGESPQSDAFFDLVRSFNIPLITHSSQKFRERWAAQGKDPASWRPSYDKQVMDRLKGWGPELYVLAGYMLIVSEDMCRRYPMINLHPAAPGGPAGTWQDVIWQLIAGRAPESGVMMHAVTPELDRGPAVTYCTYSIRGEPFDQYWAEVNGLPIEEVMARWGEGLPLFQLIRRHGLARELPLIVATLRAFAQGEVALRDGVVIDPQGQQAPPLSLTREIDLQLKGGLST